MGETAAEVGTKGLSFPGEGLEPRSRFRLEALGYGNSSVFQ